MSFVRGSSGSQTLIRALSIVVVLGAFIATRQIETGQVDTLAWAGLAVASISAAAVAIQLARQSNASALLVDGVGPTGVIVGAALVAIGIFRTVFEGVASPYSDPVLGIGLVLLLVLTFWITEGPKERPGRSAIADAAAGSGGAGGQGGDPSAGDVKSTSGASGEGTGRLTVLGSIVALVVVVGYAAMIVGLWIRSGSSDAEWSRLIGLQAGLQAAAFAALGALIGVTIQGQAVGAAQEKAGKATEAAEQAEAAKAAEAAKVLSERAVVQSQESVLESADEALENLERIVADRVVPLAVRSDALTFDLESLVQEPERLRQVGRMAVSGEDDVLLEKIRSARDDLRARRRAVEEAISAARH